MNKNTFDWQEPIQIVFMPRDSQHLVRGLWHVFCLERRAIIRKAADEGVMLPQKKLIDKLDLYRI